MSLISTLFGSGVSTEELERIRERARRRTMQELTVAARRERTAARFLSEEGKGISERTDITLGDELDLEDLTEAERLERSTGELTL